LLIFRPNATMYFPNATEVRDHIRALVKTGKPSVRAVLIDMTANDELDITSVEMLENLAEQLHHERVELLLAEVSRYKKQYILWMCFCLEVTILKTAMRNEKGVEDWNRNTGEGVVLHTH
jgi:MFS superfamily sulfate permease-like transporter